MMKKIGIGTAALAAWLLFSGAGLAALPSMEPSEGAGGASSPQDGNITLVTNGWVDVREVMGTLAGNTGFGLEIAPDVAENVNVHLVNVPLTKALESILEPPGLGYEIIDGVIIVYRKGMVTRWFNFDYPVTEREGRGELLVSVGGKSGGQDDTENQSHVTSTAVMKVWPQVINSMRVIVLGGTGGESESADAASSEALSIADSDGRILVINPMAGLVQVTAEWPRVRMVGKLLEKMQISLRRQVAIEVKILEVRLWDSERTGIDWNTITGGEADAELVTTEGLDNPVFSFIVNSKRVAGLIEAISEHGKVEVLSTPRITTLNNQKAIVRVVTEEVFFTAQVEPALVTNGPGTDPVIAYTPEMIPVGLVLDVTPQVGNDRVITLNVHPTISNIIRTEVSPNKDSAPVISVRELDTVGSVLDGQTLIIAGLMSEGTTNESSGVPILKSIPLLGYFFKRTLKEKTTTELVMMLTPVILEENGEPRAAESGK